ncbi:glutaredoxin family protein [Lysinibacillus sp. 54212]|uniref:glutaredoxin family protein n=1 Tax=Lysinibacillus sp. 54212 TaxID=3119829 RepID=UPI002FC672DD
MNSVTVYTTSSCSYCVMLKNYLTQNNVPFKEVDVGANPEMMMKLVSKTGQLGVPQTEVNGQWVLGFDPNRIMNALRNS